MLYITIGKKLVIIGSMRFKWFNDGLKGYAIYKFIDKNKLKGHWWLERYGKEIPDIKNLNIDEETKSVSTIWTRIKKFKTPDWALDYFKKMEVEIRYFIVFRIINT